MIAYSIIKYLILDTCIETLFDKVSFNFQTPDDKIKKVVYEIYQIYRKAKLEDGIDIGGFSQFYDEQMRVYRNMGNAYPLLCAQLDFMRHRYPNHLGGD